MEKTNKDLIFRRINYILMICFATLCLALMIYNVAIGDPNNRLFACLGVALLFLSPILIELLFKCKISNLVVLILIIYSVLAGILGCVLNFYNTSTLALNVWYDVFIHCLAGYVFCIIGLIIISKLEKSHKLNVWTIVIFCVCFTLAIELVWELMEWFADGCLAQQSQGKPAAGFSSPLVTDTNIDMLCNFVGALIFFTHYILAHFTRFKLGMDYIQQELCEGKIFSKKPKNIKKIEITQDQDENKKS